MIDYILSLLPGALVNIYFGVTALAIGFAFSILLAFGQLRPKGPIYYFSSAYVYVFRGSPLFIQFYLFYYLIRATGWPGYRPPGTFDRPYEFLLDALLLAPVVLTLNTIAYASVIFANALRAVPKGEQEAAEAYGFSRFKKFRRVTWPSMLRIAWPAYTNEATFLFLSTTLVYASIPVTTRPGGADYKDVFRLAVDKAEETFNPFFAYLPAMGLFVVMSLGIFFVFGLVNRYLNRHLNPSQRGPGLRFRPNFIR